MSLAFFHGINVKIHDRTNLEKWNIENRIN